jgi:hypothetical protein
MPQSGKWGNLHAVAKDERSARKRVLAMAMVLKSPPISSSSSGHLKPRPIGAQCFFCCMNKSSLQNT